MYAKLPSWVWGLFCITELGSGVYLEVATHTLVQSACLSRLENTGVTTWGVRFYIGAPLHREVTATGSSWYVTQINFNFKVWKRWSGLIPTA